MCKECNNELSMPIDVDGCPDNFHAHGRDWVQETLTVDMPIPTL